MKRVVGVAAGVASFTLSTGLAAQTIATPTSAPEAAGSIRPAADPSASENSPAAAAVRQEDNRQLGDIVVTARRVSERLQDVPVAVTAVTGVEFRQKSFRELKDIGQTVPNVRFENASTATDGINISIRGQSQADIILTTDSSVGLYLDNVSLPRLFGLRSSFVDTQRIEVLRGPQGTLYGRNTTGGAVSIFTNDPVDTLGGSVKLGYGNYDEKEAQAVLNAPLAEGLSVRLAGDIETHDGYGKNSTGRGVLAINSKYIRGKVKYTSGDFTAVLMGDYTRFHDTGQSTHFILTPGNAALGVPPGAPLTYEIAAELGGLTPENIGRAVGILTDYQNGVGEGFYDTGASTAVGTIHRGYHSAANLEYKLSPQVTARSITGYNGFKREETYDSDATPFPTGFTDTKIHQHFFSQELQLLGNMGRLSWVLGGYYSNEKGSNLTNNFYLPALTGGLVGIQDGDVTNKSIAGFAQASYKLTDKWALTGGVRYTRETKGLLVRNRAIIGGAPVCQVPASLGSTPTDCSGDIRNHFAKPSWLVSTDYKITPDIMVYGKVSRGFRGGGQNLLGTTAVTLAPFKPEQATEYELGAKTELFDRRLRLNLALWHDDYRDIQRSSVVFDAATGTTGTLITNAAAASLQGVEAEAALRATEALTLNASFGYFHAHYKTFVDQSGDRSGEDWPLTPNYTYSIGGHYVMPTSIGDGSADLGWSWRSRVNLDPSGRIPGALIQKGYGLLNGRLALSIDSINSEISVYGRNILGKKYNASGLAIEALGFDAFNRGYPRTYGVEFLVHFGGER